MWNFQISKKLKDRKRGISATGYGLVVGLISVVSLVSISAAGGSVETLFTDVGDTLNEVNAGTFTGVATGTPTPTPTPSCAVLTSGQSFTFNLTGSEQTYTIPTDCGGTWRIEAQGAQGGCETSVCDASNDHLGARGGLAVGDITLAAGDVLHIYVGGAGGNGCNGEGGYNGGSTGGGCGGGGGGASDVRLNGSTDGDRIIVAGGGGGGDDGPFCGSSTGHLWMMGGNSDPSYLTTGSAGQPTSNSVGGAGGGYQGGATTDANNFGGGGGSSYLDSSFTNTTLTAGYNGVIGCNGEPVDGSVTLTYDP